MEIKRFNLETDLKKLENYLRREYLEKKNTYKMCLKISVRVLQVSTLIPLKNEHILTYFFNNFLFFY